MIRFFSVSIDILFVVLTTMVKAIWIVIALFALITFIPLQIFFNGIDLLIGKNNKNVR